MTINYSPLFHVMLYYRSEMRLKYYGTNYVTIVRNDRKLGVSLCAILQHLFDIHSQ